MTTERNSGIVSSDLQERLANTTVAIAGVGGDGGLVSELLVRLGVGTGPEGGIRLADPDHFGEENLNRQAFSTLDTLGKNKAAVVAHQLARIRPAALKDPPLCQGIDEATVEEFVRDADLVIDETDYEKHWIGVALARAARSRNIPVFTGLNIAWGCEYTSFHPNGYTLERFLGLRETASMVEIRSANVGLSRWAVHLPPYIQLRVFKEVERGLRTVPSVSPGVALTAANVVTQVYRHIAGLSVVTAPKVGWDDAMQQRRGVIHLPSASFFWTLAVMTLRSRLKMNLPA